MSSKGKKKNQPSDIDQQNIQEEVRRKLRGLREDIRNDSDIRTDGMKLNKKLTQAAEMHGHVNNTRAGIVDAHIFQDLAKLCKGQVDNIDLNETKFNPQIFSVHVAQFIGAEINDKNGVVNSRSDSWCDFGKTVVPLFDKAPFFDYLFASFPETVEERVTVRKSSANRLMSNVARGAPTQIKKTTTAKDDDVNTFVNHVYKTFTKTLRSRKSQKIDLFKFVIDPDSFTKTIENMFYVSFLAKERKIGLIKSDNKVEIYDLLNSEETFGLKEGEEKCNQMIVTLSNTDWKSLVKNLKIDRPIIQPIKPSEPSGRKQKRT